MNSMCSWAILLVVFTQVVNCCCSIENCFKKDSISCLQLEIYQTAKSFFDKSNIELVGGVTVTSNHERRAKSLEEIETEERIMSSKHVEDRQVALEDYVTTQVKHLWNKGSISWNPKQSARSLVDTISSNIISETSNIVEEGRGKEKKQMKMLLPLLIGIKLKMAAFAAMAYMIIAVVAKKAVLAGLISLLVSGFIAAKNLMESHKMQGGMGEMTAYHSGWEAQASPIWQSGSHAAGYEQELLAANSNHQQQMAYGGKNERIFIA